ncbi:MAG TPA: hypothetical protein VFP46_00085 [Candidatus Paceibacterota bacterium]|nr:hypothetical protein [Candidatus Paceibacterota bacterium]
MEESVLLPWYRSFALYATVVFVLAVFGILLNRSLEASPPQTAAVARIDVDTGATEPASSRLFGMSGNIWVLPPAFGLVAERVLESPPGLTRVSLGDTLLSKATSMDDLEKRLASYPLDPFLKAYAKKGGRVLFILDGTPRFIASTTDDTEVKGPNQPLFRVNPPRDYSAWSEVVRAVVKHFNGELGLDAYYEAWNEPNYYYYGSFDDFMRQYYYSVLGARRADPKAKIGGPGISELSGIGTAGTLKRMQASGAYQEAAGLIQSKDFLFKQFLKRAASTPMPELGLSRMPVDFFSWHSFYYDPVTYYPLAVPVIRSALVSAGYARETPLIITEWNIAPVPPYPEGDLNATNVDAAYAIASVIAMHETGVTAQSFQMYLDPGGAGYYGGMFAAGAIPRATLHAFELASKLTGSDFVAATSSDPYIKVAAGKNGTALYILIARYAPTSLMSENTKKLSEELLGAGAAPAGARSGTSVDISVRGPWTHMTQFVVDADHGNVFPHLAEATSRLEKAMLAPADTRVAAYRSALADIENETYGHPAKEERAWPGSGTLRISVRPDSVELLILTP